MRETGQSWKITEACNPNAGMKCHFKFAGLIVLYHYIASSDNTTRRTIAACGPHPSGRGKRERKKAENPGLRDRRPVKDGYRISAFPAQSLETLGYLHFQWVLPAYEIPSQRFVFWGEKPNEEEGPRLLPAPGRARASAGPGRLPGGRRTRSRPAPARVRSSDARALCASRVLTRHGNWLLPARQGLLGADDFRTRVAHSRDGEKAVEELASPPGDRQHRQAADRGGAAGGTARSRAEQQLGDRRALDCWRRAARLVCAELLPPRNRGYLRLTPQGL